MGSVMEEIRVPHASAGVVVNEEDQLVTQSQATKEFYRWMDDVSRSLNEINASLQDVLARLDAGGL